MLKRLAGGMHLQPNDAERLPGREPHHVREIGIQRYEHAAVFNCEAQDLLVGSSGEANLKDRNSIVPSVLSSAACCGERFSSRKSFTGWQRRSHRQRDVPRIQGWP